MAGSYRHATTAQGRFRNNETFCQMVENLGDAYETAEEMFGMIWWLADYAASELAGTPEDLVRLRKGLVRGAEENYKVGLKLGGVQRER